MLKLKKKKKKRGKKVKTKKINNVNCQSNKKNRKQKLFKKVKQKKYELIRTDFYIDVTFDRPAFPAAELVQQRHDLSGPGAAQRVSQGDGPAVRVHLFQRDAQLLHTVHRLKTETYQCT